MNNVRKYTPDEDAPLLASWQRGEIISFETLVWKYLKRIYNLSYLLIGDPESSAEAVQSAFVASYREIGSLRSTSRFSTWLAGLAIKESRKLLDFREVASAVSVAAAVPVAIGYNQAESGRSPFQGEIREFIAALPPELAEVIVLRYVRGYSLERMAEILQVRAEILTSRLFDAQEMLAAQVKQGVGHGSGLQLKREASQPHPEIRSSLSIYLDNAADEKEKDAIRKHLGGCGSCREALAELEWLVEYLKSIPDVDPPHWLTAAIMTKIRSVGPAEPVRPARAYSPALVPFLLGGCLLTILGITWYLLDQKVANKPAERTPAKAAARTPLAPVAEGQASQRQLSLPAILTPSRISGRGEVRPGGVPPAASAAPQQSAAPPPPAESLAPMLPKAAPTAGGPKPETAVKKARPETSPQLPQEWGDTPPPGRAVSRKAAIQKSRSGEVAVLLRTEDPSGSVQVIEQAVTGVGGKITGRAYSSGNDIIYTQIETDKFYELMKRLAKIGKLLELPQIPEDAGENIDLVIRW